MALLIFGVVIWMALLTAAIIGFNVRLAQIQGKLGTVMSRPSGERPTGEFPPRSAILLVSETCSGCSAAIDELLSIASSHRSEPPVDAYLVLTPNQHDSRVKAPLRRITDEHMYRALYPGSAPALIVTDPRGEATLIRTLNHPTDIGPILESSRKVTDGARG